MGRVTRTTRDLSAVLERDGANSAYRALGGCFEHFGVEFCLYVDPDEPSVTVTVGSLTCHLTTDEPECSLEGSIYGISFELTLKADFDTNCVEYKIEVSFLSYDNDYCW